MRLGAVMFAEGSDHMTLAQMRSRQRVLFVGAVLGLACASAGCSSALPSIRTDDPELAKGFERLRAQVSPEDRVALDELIWRKDLLIHIVRGTLSRKDSRGGASSPSWTPFSKLYCDHHPDVDDVLRRQNWDLVYDEQLAAEWAKQSGIANPIDVVLYHEIVGHILLVLRYPEVMDALNEEQLYDFLIDTLEIESRAIENRYRRFRRLPVVPPCSPTLTKP